MYEFHYDYMKNKSRNNLRLLFTDTESLIKSEDVYKILATINRWLTLVIIQLGQNIIITQTN